MSSLNIYLSHLFREEYNRAFCISVRAEVPIPDLNLVAFLWERFVEYVCTNPVSPIPSDGFLSCTE